MTELVVLSSFALICKNPQDSFSCRGICLQLANVQINKFLANGISSSSKHVYFFFPSLQTEYACTTSISQEFSIPPTQDIRYTALGPRACMRHQEPTHCQPCSQVRLEWAYLPRPHCCDRSTTVTISASSPIWLLLNMQQGKGHLYQKLFSKVTLCFADFLLLALSTSCSTLLTVTYFPTWVLFSLRVRKQ